MPGHIVFWPYSLPLATEYRWAGGVQRERRGVLVRVSAWGAEGFGECAPPIQTPIDAEALARDAARLVSGLPVEADDFLARLDAARPEAELRCGIATAWLSARAAAAGQGLGTFLAGRPVAAEVPVNALVTDKTPEEAAARAKSFVSEGFRTLKVKCWEDRASNLARLTAIREAAPDVALRLDSNESWEPDWSLEHLRELARFGLDYVEQPLPARCSLAEMAAYRKASPVRVALDESATDPASISAILEAGAADVLILKPQRLGGPDQAALAIMRAAEHGVQVTVTVSLESAVGTAATAHVAAMLPAPLPDCGLSMGRFLARDLAEGPAVRNAAMALPPGPGLGLVPSPVALDALGLPMG
ncbi:mandelate racemase/muconate lactonizing enzyme family protein [Roseomonas xinghualingensis]|uniref:mandelate racemase/muconate lactonizing enzyme family protein n=1 Tax=Roseomonas xinghualingensis TaxID=2986475 RepID=UPI0021F11972|nr:enolase C-terminal domain-like protein [Roseomonas sp. SXEYE001]MCV4206967.1 hypothetical protein [Roseomonas sp. SXEYE001]